MPLGWHDELAALAGRRDGVDVGRVDERGQGLAVADLAGDERGPLLVVVGDDDLGDGGVAAEVPGEHLSLHAGADDEDLHLVVSLLVARAADVSVAAAVRSPFTVLVVPEATGGDKRRGDEFRMNRLANRRKSREKPSGALIFARLRLSSVAPPPRRRSRVGGEGSQGCARASSGFERTKEDGGA